MAPACQQPNIETTNSSTGVGENCDASTAEIAMAIAQCRRQHVRRVIELIERRLTTRIDHGNTVTAGRHPVDDRDHSGDARHRGQR